MPTFRKTLLVTFSVSFALAPLMAVGCSDDDDNGGAAKADAAPFCPATLTLALDPKTTCVGEGFECPIGYSCGAFDQQAYCRCEKGKFACRGGRGEDITDPATAPCTSQGTGSDKECPGSQNGTDGTSCKTPGLQCFYTGFKCPESSEPKVDICQCVSSNAPDGGATLQFRCEIKYCNPKSDASIPIPPVDASGG